MKGIYHISLAWATGILIACAISCSSQPDTKVWTVDQQLHTTDGIYRINGVCYHPVAIGIPCEVFHLSKTWADERVGGQHHPRV